MEETHNNVKNINHKITLNSRKGSSGFGSIKMRNISYPMKGKMVLRNNKSIFIVGDFPSSFSNIRDLIKVLPTKIKTAKVDRIVL